MNPKRRLFEAIVGVAVFFVAAIGWGGGIATPRAVTSIETASASTPLAGDFSTLGRLRIDAPLTPASLSASPDPSAGDLQIAPPPDSFDGTPVVAAAPPAQLRNPFEGVVPSGGTWAVSIGIDDYPGTAHDLRSAVNDASDVDEALARMGVPGDHRLMITNGQASVRTIRMGLDWLTAHAGPDAVAVVFYAGHVRRISNDTQAIVGADGNILTDVDMASALDSLQARRAWISIAACFGGGFTEVLRPGRVLTAAAPANQLAYENEGFGRSYLVEYMVRKAMIEGQAPSSSSVEAAFAWAANQISRDYPNRVPVEYDQSGGNIDLRPPRPQSAAAPPPPSSSTPSPPSGGGSSPPSSTPPPTEPKDSCSQLTLGVVRCTSG
ncbi:MAG TPA: caspase family protein [Acidimicrobiales bacterium]|nr:caspase family protein [Acidimicrobiales bacterium]